MLFSRLINKKGFTLIETMVAMAIVASVTAASYPYIIKKVQLSKANKISSVLDDIARGAQGYYADQDPKTWPGGADCSTAIKDLINGGYMPAIVDKNTGIYGGTRVITTTCTVDQKIFSVGVSTLGVSAITDYQKTVNDMVKISSNWTRDDVNTIGIEADERVFYSSTLRPEAAIGWSVITDDIIGADDGTTPGSLWDAVKNGNVQNNGIDFDIKNAKALSLNGIEIHDTTPYTGSAAEKNVALGNNNLKFNTTGTVNTAVGNEALNKNITGGANVASGAGSLFGNESGSNNTAIGYESGQKSNGSGNVFIGNRAGANELIGNDKLYISNTDTDTPLIYGEFDTQSVKVNGSVEITGSITVTGDLVSAGGGDSSGSAASAYPVGSIYMNASDSVNPATLFGFGTWARFGQGRVLVGLDSTDTDFDTIEETGGAKTHTLTEAEMPSHNHASGWYGPRGADGSASHFATSSSSYPSVNTGSSGGDGAHNNLQPYITVYMWVRTN